MLRLLVTATFLALLSSCATTPAEPPAAPEPVAQEEPKAPPEPPERPFPADSVYPLLVAEFALRRNAYDVALDNYLTQSRLLRDPGISAHTTHLTQFMQQEQQALESVQLWVELDPDNVEANNTLANLLVRQGRTLEAIPHMALVQRAGTQSNFASLLNGFDKLGEQQQASLVQGINALEEEFPDNIQLLLTQALILAEFEQYAQSRKKLNQLFAIEPYQSQAILLEAKVLLASDQPKPFAHLQEALQQHPDEQGLRLQYARLLTGTDMVAAREQFEILSQQSPRDGDLLLSLALINREVGDDTAAKAYLRQMIALQQRLNEAHYYLGRIAEDAGDPQTAISEYMQVGDSREFLSAGSRISQILVGAGQLEHNRSYFNKQRASYPQRREQLYGVEADILTRADETQAAMQTLNQGLEEFPTSPSLLYARSMLGEQQDDLALMERDLRAIIAIDPNNTTALNALGYTLANRTERYDEAYELISRALAMAPDEPAILDSMGWVLYRTGRYEESLIYLRRAYAAFPDPEVAAHLGEVLWVSGDTAGATSIWLGALANAPDHQVLLATLKRFGVSSVASGNADTTAN